MFRVRDAQGDPELSKAHTLVRLRAAVSLADAEPLEDPFDDVFDDHVP